MPLLIGMIVLASGELGSTAERAATQVEGQTMPAKTLEETLAEHADTLLAVAGVVGVAQGLLGTQPCIKVYVLEKTPQLQQRIPRVLHGYPVMVEPTGEIRALPKQP
jgi:hypothetical protein